MVGDDRDARRTGAPPLTDCVAPAEEARLAWAEERMTWREFSGLEQRNGDEHLFVYCQRAAARPSLTPEALEQARRSIVLLTPGQPSGLDREAAIAVLAELQRLQGADRRLSTLVKSLRALLGVAES